jgi:thiamine monophosphate synthase
MPAQHSFKLIPWDDREFVLAYERAAAELVAAGIRLDQEDAPIEIQRRLRAEGFPNATCYCERTAENVLAQRARCIVSRDGAGPMPLGA